MNQNLHLMFRFFSRVVGRRSTEAIVTVGVFKQGLECLGLDDDGFLGQHICDLISRSFVRSFIYVDVVIEYASSEDIAVISDATT